MLTAEVYHLARLLVCYYAITLFGDLVSTAYYYKCCFVLFCYSAPPIWLIERNLYYLSSVRSYIMSTGKGRYMYVRMINMSPVRVVIYENVLPDWSYEDNYCEEVHVASYI